MAPFRIETRRVRTTRIPAPLPPRKLRFATAIASGAGAVVAMAISSGLGNVHGHSLHERLFALLGAMAFVVLAVLAVQSLAGTLSSVVSVRAGKSGGTAVRVVASFIGYVIVVFVGLGLLDVPIQHLLLGGALTGVIVGIAAQQALGNVFAGLVLLLARPFTVDEKVRVRSGALGGVFDGVVRNVNLTYVTIETEDGKVNIPNSTMLSVGIGPAPANGTADLASAREGAPQVSAPGDTDTSNRRRALSRTARSALFARRDP